MGNTFYNLYNVEYGIAERNYLSLRCIKLQIFSVLASPSVWEVWGLITGLFKLDSVSPTACHLCSVSPPWFEAVLAWRFAAEMSPATHYIAYLVTVFYFRTVNSRITYKNNIQNNWTAREKERSNKTINVVTCKGIVEGQEK